MCVCVCVCVHACVHMCVWEGMFAGLSYVCVCISVCVYICHSRDRQKISLLSKDKNKVFSLQGERSLTFPG